MTTRKNLCSAGIWLLAVLSSPIEAFAADSGSPVGVSVVVGSLAAGVVSGTLAGASIQSGLSLMREGDGAQRPAATRTRPLPLSDRTVTASVDPKTALEQQNRKVSP